MSDRAWLEVHVHKRDVEKATEWTECEQEYLGDPEFDDYGLVRLVNPESTGYGLEELAQAGVDYIAKHDSCPGAYGALLYVHYKGEQLVTEGTDDDWNPMVEVRETGMHQPGIERAEKYWRLVKAIRAEVER